MNTRRSLRVRAASSSAPPHLRVRCVRRMRYRAAQAGCRASTTAGTSGSTASSANVRRKPAWSIAKPASSGPQQSRDRIAERQQAEVVARSRRLPELAGRVLRRHLEQHERHADQRRADDEQRRQARNDRAASAAPSAQRDRPHEHRPPHADAIGRAGPRDRAQHRQQREQREQHADDRRRRAQRAARPATRDAVAGQHDVVARCRARSAR